MVTEENPPETRFVIFLHIQKTAGISVQRVLRRKLGRSLIHRLVRCGTNLNRGGTLQQAMRSYTADDRYFAGHVCYGAHEHLPRPYTYITFIRHPVDRLLSLYHYSAVNPSSYYHGHAKGKSLEEFLLDTPLHELDNGQVRFLAGGDEAGFINRTPYGSCTPKLLEAAVSNIEQDFSLVGLTERFDESFLVLCHKMGWGRTYYIGRNRRKSAPPKVPVALRKELERRNELDIALYEYAERRIESETADMRLVASGELLRFKSRNHRFQTIFTPLYECYSSTKAFMRGQIHQPH